MQCVPGKKWQEREADNISASEISSSHGGEYDVQNFLLGCTAV
jgi:hypothetical protein